ncbi:hypothetical protein CYPRO_1663 [Cyclonatronum proteinivorum]|uniref:Uncharacterized protein n=1 Tax=Cyclonatronum proteinivorum TaxID=1457365 RepID=A0A345UKB2_9BACT|nr:hypothetical protein [Cyclonatronum proteinivorum]AXJ00914.1 hypothetical protein CYPRO_1663 [Cyclonatronum proteinivorum]
MEFLIILFIIYSFFQWLLGDKKKQEEMKRRRQQQQEQQEQDPRFDNPRTQRQQERQQQEPQSWEEAMKELESIFSGEPVETAEEKRARQEAEYRRPEPQSISRPQPKPAENPFTDNASLSARRSLNRSAEPGIRELEKAGNNPIFQPRQRFGADAYDHTDGTGSRHTTAALNLLKDPDSTQKAIILKEILDRPLSRRRREMRVF